jgi:DNA-directed RNA polymerase specialized sigma24 family protein
MLDLDAHVASIVAGDPEAFGRWVAGVEASLRGSLRPFAAFADTEAVTQEALLRVWQVAPRFVSDGNPNGLFRLAVRTARNLALSEVRRAKVDPAEAESLERALSKMEAELHPGPDPLLRSLIEKCREKLPSKPAMALMARLSGASEPDRILADRLKMHLNTFLQNFTRARKLLAECLKKNGYDLTRELP